MAAFAAPSFHDASGSAFWPRALTARHASRKPSRRRFMKNTVPGRRSGGYWTLGQPCPPALSLPRVADADAGRQLIGVAALRDDRAVAAVAGDALVEHARAGIPLRREPPDHRRPQVILAHARVGGIGRQPARCRGLGRDAEALLHEAAARPGEPAADADKDP